MIAVGIDISKGKSMVAILNHDGSVRAQPYEMHHSKPELDALICLYSPCQSYRRYFNNIVFFINICHGV